MNEKIHMKIPIRYGRLSGSKKNKSYTMVFSKECELSEKLGTAYLIPFKRSIIRSFTGVVNQARFLSEAENSKDNKLCKGGHKKWCTIGILFNQNFDREQKSNILHKWKNLIVKDGGLSDYNEYKVGNEESILSNEGEVLINWPQAVDNDNQIIVDQFDFILATCTKPNQMSYPTIEQIQNKIKNDDRKYFYRNIENGITTYQDREILNFQ